MMKKRERCNCFVEGSSFFVFFFLFFAGLSKNRDIKKDRERGPAGKKKKWWRQKG
jgi:hypothetical protein